MSVRITFKKMSREDYANQTYYVVKSPSGNFYFNWIWTKKEFVIRDFVECFGSNEQPWSQYYKEGYRCVKIKFTEVK